MTNEEEALADFEIRVIEKEETPIWKRKQSKRKPRKWNDEETDLLIDLFEQNACLWDVFFKDYHLKDKRDKAYETMQEELGITGPKSQLARS